MKISKRITAVFLALCMMIPIISLLPFQTVSAANTESASAPVSAETYSELGFNTMSEDEYPTNERLDRRYSVTNVQNELYVHVNADEHYISNPVQRKSEAPELSRPTAIRPHLLQVKKVILTVTSMSKSTCRLFILHLRREPIKWKIKHTQPLSH